MNKSKAGPMRPDTKKRLVDRAAYYLEQEARAYRDGVEFLRGNTGRRAARLFAAARTLRNLEFK